MNTVESPTKLHPVTVATVWHSMQTICHEMRHVIDRTAQCFLIALLHDISVGIWDGQGRHTIAIPTGLPVQFMGGKYTMRYILEQFGDEIYPGDVFLTNDPYHGASCHLPDWAFIRPIFFEDEMVFFTMARAHQYDTGGSFPGGYFPNAYDIHAEGICIPPVKVFERGVERKDIFQLVWNNTRWPEGVRVDNYAMIAATKVCEKRLVGLMKKYGKEVVKECVDEMLRRTEKAVRAEVTKIPDGTYSSESSTDDDGTELDVPVTVRLDLTVRGEEMILDFSRSDGQRRGFVNSIYASTYSNAMAATLIFFDPELADFHNEGSMAPISIIAPEGSVLNARYPATVGASPVAMGTHTMEAVLLALSKAMPNHAVAPWARHYSHYIFGVDPRTGVQYVQTTFDSDGGAGAMSGYDGFEGAATLATLAEVNRSNTEEVEIRVPWRMLHYEFATDTAGVGKWRGASVEILGWPPAVRTGNILDAIPPECRAAVTVRSTSATSSTMGRNGLPWAIVCTPSRKAISLPNWPEAVPGWVTPPSVIRKKSARMSLMNSSRPKRRGMFSRSFSNRAPCRLTVKPHRLFERRLSSD